MEDRRLDKLPLIVLAISALVLFALLWLAEGFEGIVLLACVLLFVVSLMVLVLASARMLIRVIAPRLDTARHHRMTEKLVTRALNAGVIDADFAAILRGHDDFYTARGAFRTYVAENRTGNPEELLSKWDLRDVDI